MYFGKYTIEVRFTDWKNTAYYIAGAEYGSPLLLLLKPKDGIERSMPLGNAISRPESEIE